MPESKITKSFLEKLDNPNREIRERNLLTLISKLDSGVKFDNEFQRTKELVMYLINWLRRDDRYQAKILELILKSLKTKAGNELIKVLSPGTFLNELRGIKFKINSKCEKVYHDIIIYISGCVETADIRIPALNMPLSADSDKYLNTRGFQEKNLHVGNKEFSLSKLHSFIELNSESTSDLTHYGIKIFLMPWCHLNESDLNKIKSNEECMKTPGSEEKAIYFFNSILSKDFPAEVFLNRPSILLHMLKLFDNKELSICTMESILSFCFLLYKRINEICDLSSRSCKKTSFPKDELDLQSRSQITETSYDKLVIKNSISTLKQLPLPYFCVDTMYHLINLIGQNVMIKSQKINKNSSTVRELNLAITIVHKLFIMLKKVVNNAVWKAQRSNRFVEELTQKLVLFFHPCGDVLNKLRILCLMNDTSEPPYRAIYVRLLIFCVELTCWCNCNAFMPHNFISSLCDSICDASFSNSYPKTHKILTEMLQNFIDQNGSMEEKNKLKQFLNVGNIALSMSSSIEIFHNFGNLVKSPNIIYTLKGCLPALEYHKNVKFISIVLDIFSSKLNKWLLTDDHWNSVKTIVLELLAHNCAWVKKAFYSGIFSLVNDVLNGTIKTKDDSDAECLKFLFEPTVFVEICSHGLESDCEQVNKFARGIIQHLLRGKLLMSDQLWKTFLDAFLPALPLLQVRSTYADEFGKSILKTLELNVGEYMLIPRIEIVKGNIRLLYSKSSSAKMSGSNNILRLIYANEEAENMLPKQESVIPDLLCSTMQSLKEKNFNINKPGDKDFYEEGALLQIMSILKENMPKTNDDNYLSERQVKSPIIDPLVCKSALAQLAAILQQTNLHGAFIKNKGQEIIIYYMRTSLLVDEFTTFPESIMSCISLLNSICYSNTNIRQWASEQQNILFYIIRAILLFPNEEYFVSTASQLLCLLIFSHFIINSNSFDDGDEGIYTLSMHSSIVDKINLPFKTYAYSKVSPHQNLNTEAWIMEQPSLSNYLRIHWCANWYGGFDKVVKWPYVPESSIDDDYNNTLKINDNDLYLMKMTCPVQGCVVALYEIQNATSHKSVNKAINMLEGYIHLAHEGNRDMNEFIFLPWCNTLRRFLLTPPASPKDAELLLNFVRFIEILLQTFHNNPKCIQIFSGLVKPVIESSNKIVTVYKNEDFNTRDDLSSTKLNGQICQLISYCCALTSLPFYEKIDDSDANWTLAINHLINSLDHIQINNVTALVYADQIICCLIHLTAFSCNNLQGNDTNENLFSLSKKLINLCDTLYTKKHYMEYKGYSLLLNSMTVLCHVLEIVLSCSDDEIECFRSILVGNSRKTLLSFCITHYDSQHVWVRSASFKLLSGLTSSALLFSYLKTYDDNIVLKITKVAIDTLCDFNEASFVREQAAVTIRNILYSFSRHWSSDTQNELSFLFNSIFFENLTVTLTKICVAEEHLPSIGENISLTYLSKKENCEVAFSKTGINDIPMNSVQFMPAKCSIKLLIIIADVIYNILQIYDNVIEELGHSEIFKIIFRCILLDIPNTEIKLKMCASICRLLYKVTNLSDEILTTLVDTRNCVNGLLKLFALDEDLNSNQMIAYVETQKWCFQLLGSFLKTHYGFKSIWNLISEGGGSIFFYRITSAISEKMYNEIIPSALYCFCNLLHSYTSYETDAGDLNLEYFLDKDIEIKDLDSSNDSTKDGEEKNPFNKINLEVFFAKENTNKDNCKIIFGEKLCLHLIELYKISNKNSMKNRVQAPHFDKIVSSLCNLFGISNKAKFLAVENGFLEEIIQNLNETQYFLVTTNDQLNLIRSNDKSPVLHYLNWTILLLGNTISNCNKAKEISTECNLSSYINKLWPWIISSGMLRFYTIQMLCSYTNSNLRACQSMCSATIGRSLLSEVIDLVMKEMNLVTRKHPLETLSGCLQILQNICSHLHCRSIIIKSDLFSSLNKLHPAITKRQPQWRKVEIIWEDFLNTITRYPEGQIKVAEYLGNICALIHQADGLMFEVLRNCAFNPFNRPRFLGSAEVMLLFSKTLTSTSPMPQKLSVCSALWALCANSQKSKLSIKSAGLHAKLSDCVQTLRNTPADHNQEIQIMSYVLKIINSP